MVILKVLLATFLIFQNVNAQTEKPLAKTLKIRADIWCPFNCEPSNKKPGFMIEVVDKILSKEGYTIDYQIINWTRALHEAKIGKVDAVIGAGKEDAEGFTFPDEPQGQTQYFIFGQESTKWKYVDESSLQNIKLGVINSYTYDKGTNELINKKHPSLEVISSESPLDSLTKLLSANKIIGFIESDFVLDYYIKNNHLTRLKKLGQIKPNIQELYLAISPKHPEGKHIANLLTLGTRKLRSDGSLKKILAKYGLKDWK